jgi:hypothetical protein
MSGLTHADLVERAAKWLRNTAGCRLVLTEFYTTSSTEIPDAIGWLGRWNWRGDKTPLSVLLECKTSRADFLRDKHKTCATRGSRMGAYRFYFAPLGILRPDEIEEPWGLLEVNGAKVMQTKRPWKSDELPIVNYPARDLGGEIGMLISAAQMKSRSATRQLAPETLSTPANGEPR